MKIMERVIVRIRPEMWDELERVELQFEALESQWGFPTSKRYRPGASGIDMDVLIVEREWESYAAREKAYEEALKNPQWRMVDMRSHSVIESVQSEFYHPLDWKMEDLKEPFEATDLEEIKKRLNSGKLTTADISIIRNLIDESIVRPSTIAGRPVVAHLPNGMDVIK